MKKRKYMKKKALLFALLLTGATVVKAQAEQKEFIPLYQEFKQAPELVWQRMYTEAMEQVWRTVGRQDFVPANSRVILTDEQEVQQ